MKKYGHEISLTVNLKGKTVLTLGRNVLHISLTEYYFLIAILRRQYRIILAASWEKIFSSNAADIMRYWRLKITTTFVSRTNHCKDK